MFAIDEADSLIDFFRGGDFGGDGDRLGVMKDSVSQFFDRGAKGGGEEEGLPLVSGSLATMRFARRVRNPMSSMRSTSSRTK